MTSQGSSGCHCQHPSVEAVPYSLSKKSKRVLHSHTCAPGDPRVRLMDLPTKHLNLQRAVAFLQADPVCSWIPPEKELLRRCIAIASTAHLTSLDTWGVGRKYLHSVPKTCTQSPQFPLNFRLDGRPPSAGKVAIIYNKHTETIWYFVMQKNATDA